ncbi:DNA repair protein RecN [Ectothiorhodospiraceae bacterium WFHF3C12]|nr:DNA repair protein RecN [Ectothiorhodospiraceae bacterium WFHF3C12]
MLSHIHIRNFAIVDELELELRAGMGALTGETGAGKSILLDALGLCLGDRADSDAVGPAEDRSEINVSFDISDVPAAGEWLAEQALDADGECLLRRVVQRNGRSQAFINGRPVPLQSLSELGELLVDIHGQHAHQSLMKRDAQREIIDRYGRHEGLLQRVAGLYRDCQQTRREIRELEGGQEDYQDRLDLLRFQVGELDALDMTAEEIESLDAEQRRLASAGETLEACQQILSMLYEDDSSAQSGLSAATRRLEDFAELDANLDNALQLFNESLVRVEEGCNALRHYADNTEVDPARLQWVEDRIGTLHDLARKHRVAPEALPQRLEELKDELERLENAESRLLELRQQLGERENDYRAAAVELSYARQRTATDLGDRATEIIQQLGMPGGEVYIRIEMAEDGKISPTGLDNVQFEVRTNPDRPFGPLNRVASGGELSRIGLALEVVSAHATLIPTLIFDEADTGIGGAVAEVVGRKLRELGEMRQVLCVTHLPQVAAQAHHQLQVTKATVDGTTRTDVRPLEGKERTEELARMLGGVEITENTLRHAQEMLERAG